MGDPYGTHYFPRARQTRDALEACVASNHPTTIIHDDPGSIVDATQAQQLLYAVDSFIAEGAVYPDPLVLPHVYQVRDGDTSPAPLDLLLPHGWVMSFAFAGRPSFQSGELRIAAIAPLPTKLSYGIGQIVERPVT